MCIVDAQMDALRKAIADANSGRSAAEEMAAAFRAEIADLRNYAAASEHGSVEVSTAPPGSNACSQPRPPDASHQCAVPSKGAQYCCILRQALVVGLLGDHMVYCDVSLPSSGGVCCATGAAREGRKHRRGRPTRGGTRLGVVRNAGSATDGVHGRQVHPR